MILLDMAALAAPGWLPLVITLIFAGILVLLFLNMRKQIRRIDVPDDAGRMRTSPFAGADDLDADLLRKPADPKA